jgi:hypothetical protein
VALTQLSAAQNVRVDPTCKLVQVTLEGEKATKKRLMQELSRLGHTITQGPGDQQKHQSFLW